MMRKISFAPNFDGSYRREKKRRPMKKVSMTMKTEATASSFWRLSSRRYSAVGGGPVVAISDPIEVVKSVSRDAEVLWINDLCRWER